MSSTLVYPAWSQQTTALQGTHRSSCAGGEGCCLSEADLWGVRVLYVDHDPASRQRTTRLMADAGMVVDAVPSARAAMRLLRLGAHQALVIDLDPRSSLAEVELLHWAAQLRLAPALVAVTSAPLLSIGLKEASFPVNAAVVASTGLEEALTDPYLVRHLMGRIVWSGSHASVHLLEVAEAQDRFLASAGRRQRKKNAASGARSLLEKTYLRLDPASVRRAEEQPLVL